MKSFIIIISCLVQVNFVVTRIFDSDKIRNISCDYNSRYPEGYLEVELAPIPECQASCEQRKLIINVLKITKFLIVIISIKYLFEEISEQFCNIIPKIARSCICNKGYIRHSRDWTCVPEGFCHWTLFLSPKNISSDSFEI